MRSTLRSSMPWSAMVRRTLEASGTRYLRRWAMEGPYRKSACTPTSTSSTCR
ncbi:unnamed protein product [Ectocarpus fasciculatus]